MRGDCKPCQGGPLHVCVSGWSSLGSNTPCERIHKLQSHVGVQSTKLPLQIEGAPNTRSVNGQNVYGSAMPTVEGIKNVLDHVGCAPSSDLQVAPPCLLPMPAATSSLPLHDSHRCPLTQKHFRRIHEQWLLLQASATWFNMREEVLVYVNGRPLVLREDERPFKNMQACTPPPFSNLQNRRAAFH
jgi:hypothetical protein